MTNRTNRHYRQDVRGASSASELLQRAGPDFAARVDVRPAGYQDETGVFHAGPGQVVFRTDTGEALSLVGPSYVPAQVADFLAPLDPLLRSGQLVAVSACAFDRGLTLAVELQLPEPLRLPGPGGTEDVILRRVVWRDNRDGSARLQWFESLLRQWCANGAAHAFGMSGVAYKHTAARMAEARDAFSLETAVRGSLARFAVVESNARLLLSTPFHYQQMVRVTARLYPATESGEVSLRSCQARGVLGQLFQSGRGNRGATAWDALNALTEWSTHQRPVRGSQAALTRLRAIWFGDEQVTRGLEAVAQEAGLSMDPEGVLYR